MELEWLKKVKEEEDKELEWRKNEFEKKKVLVS